MLIRSPHLSAEVGRPGFQPKTKHIFGNLVEMKWGGGLQGTLFSRNPLSPII